MDSPSALEQINAIRSKIPHVFLAYETIKLLIEAKELFSDRKIHLPSFSIEIHEEFRAQRTEEPFSTNTELINARQYFLRAKIHGHLDKLEKTLN